MRGKNALKYVCRVAYVVGLKQTSAVGMHTVGPSQAHLCTRWIACIRSVAPAVAIAYLHQAHLQPLI